MTHRRDPRGVPHEDPDANRLDHNPGEREMELARGTRLLGADKWSDEQKLELFMIIFHPEHTR